MATYTTDKIEFGGNVYSLEDANALVSSHHANTNGNNSGKYYKISINSYTGWMLNFTVRIYHAYRAYDIQISGYNYGSSHWYSPAAVILGASVTNSINVIFGYDSSYHLWVAIPAEQYSGVDVYYGTNGYQQATDKKNLFTIELVEGIPETAQTTVTAYRPWYRNETVTNAENAASATNATNAAGISLSTALTAETIDSFRSNTLKIAHVSGYTDHGLSGNDGVVVYIPWSANYGQQLLFDDGNNKVWNRGYSGSGWTEWTKLNPPTSAASHVTGISIANHGTSSITGVSGSVTGSHVKSGGNGTAPTLGTAFTVPNVTAKGSGSFTSGAFSGGSGSFSATVTNHVMSFSHTHTAATHAADSHTHTAPTLGTAFTIPNVTSVGSASNWVFEDVTVPKAASATTVVTGASHTITDNGHTHTLS